jgi:threonine dehydrogenase-like Zn-dependent dehydrogenase
MRNRAAVLTPERSIGIEDRPLPEPGPRRLVASGRVDVEAIVTGPFGLDEAETALRAPREDPASVKPVVHP